MARVEVEGAPETEAPDNLPDRYGAGLRVSPEQFGGLIAEGAQQAFQGGMDLLKFHNQVAADHATNNVLDQVNNVLYGDPSKPQTDANGNPVLGPDGKPMPDTGYFGLRGDDAMRARPEVTQRIDDIIHENQSDLAPAAAEQFENESRRYRAKWLSDVAGHADTQQKTWATDTNNNRANLALNAVARDPFNESAAADAQQSVRMARVRNAQIAGENPDAAMLKGDQDVLLTRLRAGMLKNPTATQKLFNDKGNILASLPNYDEIGRQIKTQVVESQIGPIVDSSVNSALSQASAAVANGSSQGGFDKAWQFTFGHEGGYSPADANGQPVKYGINQAANPGVDIKNLTPNAAKGIARQYWDKSGAANLPPGLGTVHFDTYYINPGEATKILQESGGDPQKYMQLRETWMNGLIAKDPAKFGRYEKAWDTRNRDLEAGIAANPQAGATGQNLSVPDQIRLNEASILDGVRTKAQAAFGDQYPDAVERAVVAAQRRIEQTIAQQDQQYVVASHIVQRALAGDHPPTSEKDLLAMGPQVADAWKTMQFNDPWKAQTVENYFNANAHGRASGYGTNFGAMLDRVLAPANDNNRLRDPSQVWSNVTPGENGPLTNTGANALAALMKTRGTPQGEADATALRNFFHEAHGMLSRQDPNLGFYDPKGEEAYTRFLMSALPMIESAQAQHQPLATLLAPKGDVYNSIFAFKRKPGQDMLDRIRDPNNPAVQAANQTPEQTAQAQADLRARYAAAKSPAQKNALIDEGIARGWIAKPEAPKPDVPLPQ